MYKLIAIDIDDTLLNDNYIITARTEAAIEAAVKKGVKVVLCTGRTIKGALRYYKQLNLDTLFITAGGAEIYDSKQNRLFEDEVDPKLVKQVLQYAYDNGFHAQVYIDGELIYRERNKYSEMYEGPYGFPGTLIPNLMDLKEIITPKVLYVIDADKAPGVQKEVQKLFPSLAIKRSKPSYIEFMSPSISKGTALSFTADYYGINLSDVIAIGDSQIDAAMIEEAGLGVAVQNAPASLKKIADITSPSNEDEGVAYVIEKYILEAD